MIWFFLMVFLEVWSIIRVSDHIGALATLVLLVAGFVFGLQLMRSQGINAMMKAAQSVQPGESPLAPLAEAIVRAFAGILLIIPGFFTDVIAMILLLPFVRKAFGRYLAKKGQFQGFAAGGFGASSFSGAFGAKEFGSGAFDQSHGNVYEHKGSAKSLADEIPSGLILDHKPDDKN